MIGLTLVLLAALVAFLAVQGKFTLRALRSFDDLRGDQVGGVPFQLISKEAQVALTEFSQEFNLALVQPGVEPWSRELGLYKASRALRTWFPVPVSAAGYTEFRGDLKYRELFEKRIELIPKTWQDGVSELAQIIEAPDFIGWQDQPNAMARAAISLPNELVQQQLEANPLCWDLGPFFAGSTLTASGASNATPIVVTTTVPHGLPTGATVTGSGFGTNTAANATFTITVLTPTTFSLNSSVGNGATGAGVITVVGHPFNVLDTTIGSFQNDFQGTGGATKPSLTNLETAKVSFRKIKAPNGKPLGLRMTHVLVPPAQEELWRDLLEQDTIIQTAPLPTPNAPVAGSFFGSVQNRHKGTVKLVVADELSNDFNWYPLALGKPGMYPWIVQDEGAPEEILSDKTSDLYKRTLKVALGYILRGNAALALPHCVQRWAGT